MLREKIRAIQADLKKQEKHQINNLNLYLKQLEKEEQKSQSKKERINFRAEISGKEMKETVANINKTK